MSHAALQRLVVRMLYDGPFVDAVYAAPDATLAAEELTAAERRHLVAPDKRAWKVDPLRRSRSLHALLEEFPAAGALALAGGAGMAELDGFFSSQAFHAGIQSRRSLAAVFKTWLGERFGEPVAPIAQLEGAVAAVRRGHVAAIPEGALGLAPRLRALDVRAGTTGLYQAVMVALGGAGDVVARLLDPMFALGPLPALEAGREYLLVEASAEGGVGLEGASHELVALLSAASPPRPREALLGLARRLGCAPGEDAEIVDGLAADGLLVRA